MTEPPPGAAPLDAAAIAAASLAQPAAVSARQPPPSAAPPAAADSRPRDSGLSVGQEAVAETAAQTSAPLPPPPLYPTQMAPSFTRHYAVRRGGVAGSGELILEVGAGRYALELRSSAMGVDLIGLTSRGQIDANGFAPERFVDRRRGRDRLAANFDPAARHITYSGATATQPLHPGTQDRLSWMLQLAAIVQAQPQRFEPGQRIVMAVSGARADLDLWVFEVVDRGPVVLPSGTVAQALHLTRAPRRPYDTQAEIWLDAAQHHLPVRARLTVLPGGHTLELAWTGG